VNWINLDLVNTVMNVTLSYLTLPYHNFTSRCNQQTYVISIPTHSLSSNATNYRYLRSQVIMGRTRRVDVTAAKKWAGRVGQWNSRSCRSQATSYNIPHHSTSVPVLNQAPHHKYVSFSSTTP